MWYDTCFSCFYYFFFFKQKTAYEILASDWSSDVCSSDLELTEMFFADFNIGDKTWQKTFQMMSVITKNFPSNIPNNYLDRKSVV